MTRLATLLIPGVQLLQLLLPFMHPSTKTCAIHVQVKVTVCHDAHVVVHVSPKGTALQPFHQKLDLIQKTEETGYFADGRKHNVCKNYTKQWRKKKELMLQSSGSRRAFHGQ
jgi:hypothetical protein